MSYMTNARQAKGSVHQGNYVDVCKSCLQGYVGRDLGLKSMDMTAEAYWSGESIPS